MSKIAVIITDLFEDSEYTEPVKAFKEKGHAVVHVGLKQGETVKGKKKGTEVRVDRAIGAVSVDEFDALLIPGGYSPDKLRAHEEPVQFVRDFVNSGKPVFSICHAPSDSYYCRCLEGAQDNRLEVHRAGHQECGGSVRG
jgi:protease I